MRIHKPLKIVIFSVGIIMAIPVFYLGYLYITYIDESIITGEAYGFTIGQSKAEAYKVAAAKFDAGEIVAIDTLSDMEDEMARFPESQCRYTVAEVISHFDQWDTWILSFGGRLTTSICFEGGNVLGAGRAGRPDKVWNVQTGDNTISISPGQSYEEVYQTLVELTGVQGYEDMLLETGWMARRHPGTFDESEFRFVSPCDFWDLLIDEEHGYFNDIELTFTQDRLVRIHRHRQYFELP